MKPSVMYLIVSCCSWKSKPSVLPAMIMRTVGPGFAHGPRFGTLIVVDSSNCRFTSSSCNCVSNRALIRWTQIESLSPLSPSLSSHGFAQRRHFSSTPTGKPVEKPPSPPVVDQVRSYFADPELRPRFRNLIIIVSIIAATVGGVWLFNTVTSWIRSESKVNPTFLKIVFFSGVITCAGIAGLLFAIWSANLIDPRAVCDYAFKVVIRDSFVRARLGNAITRVKESPDVPEYLFSSSGGIFVALRERSWAALRNPQPRRLRMLFQISGKKEEQHRMAVVSVDCKKRQAFRSMVQYTSIAVDFMATGERYLIEGENGDVVYKGFVGELKEEGIKR